MRDLMKRMHRDDRQLLGNPSVMELPSHFQKETEKCVEIFFTRSESAKQPFLEITSLGIEFSDADISHPVGSGVCQNSSEIGGTRLAKRLRYRCGI